MLIEMSPQKNHTNHLPRAKIWYFDTSAINYLMDELTLAAAKPTKLYQLNKGIEWRLSPIVIWEILMTSDEVRREKLIVFCQHLFCREILPSPSELIIPYIQAGMPKIETPRELISKSPIASTWRDLVDDTDKTFIFEYDALKTKIKLVQKCVRDIHKIIRNEDVIIGPHDSPTETTLSFLINNLSFVKSKKLCSRDEILAYTVSLYYIMIVLCAEVEIDNGAIKNFWQSIGIDSVLDRIMYVVDKIPQLIHTGPFFAMALMSISQSTTRKYPRGMYFDSMHSVYVTYVDMVLTADNHFLALRNLIPQYSLKKKIFHMNEGKLTTRSRLL